MHGTAYAVRVTPSFLDSMRALKAYSRAPQLGASVGVKLQGADSVARHEERMHAFLSDPSTCGSLDGRRACTAPLVPRLFAAGVVPADAARRRRHAIVMDLVDGVSLSSASRRSGGLDARVFRAYREAMLTLWAVGVSHNDFHGGNVLVSDAGVKVLDFGHSLVLPRRLRSRAEVPEFSKMVRAEADRYAARTWSGVRSHPTANVVMLRRYARRVAR